MSARGALHIAVMERHGIRSILSFDADFDRWPGLERIYRVLSRNGLDIVPSRPFRGRGHPP